MMMNISLALQIFYFMNLLYCTVIRTCSSLLQTNRLQIGSGKSVGQYISTCTATEELTEVGIFLNGFFVLWTVFTDLTTSVQ